uniref:Tissue factor pathway inhibitor 2 n=1 Tax=Amphilophus citrinellus TaxID=61819 RepID=A0A3Q0QQN7_AMPCI
SPDLSPIFTLLPPPPTYCFQSVCLLEVDEGPCRGNIERYYYNTITQKCEVFYYGGCQGNANNFKSYQECHKTCYKIPKVPPICRVPKDEGPCRALLPSYFFNMTTMQCEPFSYGGCQGNSNRFQNLASCMEYCSPKKFPPVLCREPLDKGKCSASITRYYYNAATKMCEEFVYSGCGGSNNNFVSLQGCMDVCGKGVQYIWGGLLLLRTKAKSSIRSMRGVVILTVCGFSEVMLYLTHRC